MKFTSKVALYDKADFVIGEISFLHIGAATVHVTSGSLNDNAWHKVVVTRRGKSITVDVDDTTKG